MRLSWAIIIFCVFPLTVNGQIDAHYWTHQYGAKGLLLNGAVIASSDDETAIFYNPACMGQGNNLGFVFSFLTPTYSSLRNSNFTGEGSSFSDDDLGFSPGFAAVRLKPFKTDKIILGIASFERLSSDIRFTDRVVLPVDNFDEVFYIGNLDFTRKLSQEWLGFGLSYNINEHLGIGVSQFSIWHSENLDFNFRKEVVLRENPETLVFGWRSKFEYNLSAYAGWITKLGIVWDTHKFKFGATLTTPAYGFPRKTASYAIDDQRLTQAVLDISSNRRDIELSNFKTPVSFGVGMEVAFEDLTVSFSSEYFRSISEYTLFSDTDDPYEGIAENSESTVVNVSTSNNRVINFALGFQSRVDEKLTWLWGLRTDFNQKSSLNLNGVTSYLSSSPSIFHISGGARFTSPKNEISVGIDYGYGRRTGGRQLTDLQDLNIFNFFEFGSESNVTTTAHSVIIFLTYDFLFGRIREVN